MKNSYSSEASLGRWNAGKHWLRGCDGVYWRAVLKVAGESADLFSGWVIIVCLGRTRPILYVCLFVCLFVCLLACLFVCLLACLFVCLFVCLFACLLVCVFVCLFVCSFVCLFLSFFVCLLGCLFVLSPQRTGGGAAVWLSFQTWNRHKTSLLLVFHLLPFLLSVQKSPYRGFLYNLSRWGYSLVFCTCTHRNLTGILTNLSGMFIVFVTFSRTSSWTVSSEGSHWLPSKSLPID